MKLRWKLLLVLLAITAAPMLVLSFMTHEASYELINETTARSRKVLILRAEAELKRRMEDHVAIVSREHIIINLALKAQSGRLCSIIEGSEKRVGRMRDRGLEDSKKHFVRAEDGTYVPLKIDRDKVRFDFTQEATITPEEAKQLFRPMIRVFRKLENANPDLIYWQLVKLNNGVTTTYPYYEMEERLPTRHFPLYEWDKFVKQISAPGVVWTMPFRDPVTGRFVMAATSKIQNFKGKYHGAMALMVPLKSLLKGDLDLTGMSKNTSSLLVRAMPKQSGGIGLLVIAEEHEGESSSDDRGGWIAGEERKWIENEDNAALDSIATDLRNGKSGTKIMSYKGKECLWVYARINLGPSSLILIVPMENIIGTTIATENYLKDKIGSLFTSISGLIWVMLAIIAIVSILLSKTMTRRISDLAVAFDKLGEGDFSARVDVRGKDELSGLGQSFNTLAPALEEQVRLKEALTIAQEVQRSLLPEKPPQTKGLDVAGASVYCEDTGGDYFDYPHLGIEADELGLAVGDVSGHGIPAALLMTTARAFLRQRAQHGGNLGSVVGDANKMLAEDVRLSGRFMTLFLFAVDPETRTARWVRAGHDPAMVYLPSTDTFSELGGDTGLPLGVDGDWNYIEEHATLNKGAVILIGTDGIWEAANKNGEMYGKQRLNTILRQQHDKPSQTILETILQSLKEFTGEAGFEDDVTLAVVKITDK